LEKYIQCIYDFNTLDSINAFEDKFRSILSNNCSLIAFAGLDPNYGVEVYDYNKKQQLWQLPINGPSITGIEFSPDDKYLVKSPGLEIWSMETGLNLYIYQSGSSDNFDISHNGKYIISSVGSYLFLWYARFGINPVHDSPDSVKQIIYPNPTTGKATIQFAQPFPEITDIILTDINGNQIQNLFNKFLNSGNQILDFDISRFTIGTYFIRVQNSHLSLIFKLIITK
jgi:WD40 repeat protein